MLALPVRPHPAHLNPQDRTCTTLPAQASLSTSSPPPATAAPAAIAGGPAPAPAAMSLSIMPSSQPPAKRPKLSIQTSMLPLSLGHKSTTALTLSIATDTPTVHNTYANAFDVPLSRSPQEPFLPPRHATPTSPPASSSSSSTFSSSRQTSPFPASIPYTLPMTARSILRNSPLPRRHLSATSARTPRIMFPPVKRVMFRDRLEELIPTMPPPADDHPHPNDPEDPEEAIVLPREDRDDAREADHVPSTPVQGRRKRRRDWVWTLGPIEVGAPPGEADDERERPDRDPGACGRDEEVRVRDGPAESPEPETGDVFQPPGPLQPARLIDRAEPHNCI